MQTKRNAKLREGLQCRWSAQTFAACVHAWGLGVGFIQMQASKSPSPVSDFDIIANRRRAAIKSENCMNPETRLKSHDLKSGRGRGGVRNNCLHSERRFKHINALKSDYTSHNAFFVFCFVLFFKGKVLFFTPQTLLYKYRQWRKWKTYLFAGELDPSS